MVEEFGAYSESTPEIQEGAWETGEWSKESVQQAISRIEKNQKKASQTRGQIRKQKKENTQLAQFLIMLINTLTNSKVLTALHHVFFSPETGGPYKNVNHKVVVGLFIPFYRAEMEQFKLQEFYQELLPPVEETIVLSNYIDYLKKLSFKYHDDIALNQQNLLQLIVYIVLHFTRLDVSEFNDDQKKELIISIVQDLFGIQNQIDVKKVRL